MAKKKRSNAAPVNQEISYDEPKPAKPSNGLIKMVNDDGKHANVHPDEVDNYALGGFKKV